ncbi:MAG: hypothetical protein JST30_17200 [Armatimonadetes bacterium]|nr:hypothetical protein [Armatimonadota bacterium]
MPDRATRQTLNLDTDVTQVPPGTIVRVFNLTSSGAGAVVTVKVGGSNLSLVSVLHMSEFVFYVDGGGTGHWLVVQGNVTSAQLP